ncbi:hypothetical protein HFM85_09045 [Blautia schinkii]|uniref:DUF6147 family protein n=1 Tax=Blautia schinkii TaxID=180164 RepID=UPI001570937A|nr:DUF6147 family protein [Blautia schinkii]NSG82531.1 hypothetical protein [Blautia schinkii]NSK23134.1 hypothetical protein [Blautia schinkii]NSK26174.1 hypothetical protein [Blautia schinkii]NSK32184.1 hypothetical protein [Blautia schinkii]NSK35168.1 hypothetical protein [Blautia schinkii]
MKEKGKKLVKVICMIICLSLVNFIPVMADNTITDLETEADFAEDTTYSVLRGNNLNFGTTTVKKLASNKVLVSGITQCHHNCATVYLNLYLERKVNGTYSTYKNWTFTASNVSNLTKDITVIVPKGYYYRVRGYHAAKDGSKESVRTVTKGVLVK